MAAILPGEMSLRHSLVETNCSIQIFDGWRLYAVKQEMGEKRTSRHINMIFIASNIKIYSLCMKYSRTSFWDFGTVYEIHPAEWYSKLQVVLVLIYVLVVEEYSFHWSQGHHASMYTCLLLSIPMSNTKHYCDLVLQHKIANRITEEIALYKIIVESNVTQFPDSKIHRVDIIKTSIKQFRVGSMCNRCRFEAAFCLGKWPWSPFLHIAEAVSTALSLNDLRKSYLSCSCSLMISNKICVPLTGQPLGIV